MQSAIERLHSEKERREREEELGPSSGCGKLVKTAVVLHINYTPQAR